MPEAAQLVLNFLNSRSTGGAGLPPADLAQFMSDLNDRVGGVSARVVNATDRKINPALIRVRRAEAPEARS